MFRKGIFIVLKCINIKITVKKYFSACGSIIFVLLCFQCKLYIYSHVDCSHYNTVSCVSRRYLYRRCMQNKTPCS